MSIKEISIYSNSCHIGWKIWLLYTILKVDNPKDHQVPVLFGSKVSGKKNLMWFLSNKPNLHNQYNLAERQNCHAAAV